MHVRFNKYCADIGVLVYRSLEATTMWVANLTDWGIDGFIYDFRNVFSHTKIPRLGWRLSVAVLIEDTLHWCSLSWQRFKEPPNLLLPLVLVVAEDVVCFLPANAHRML